MDIFRLRDERIESAQAHHRTYYELSARRDDIINLLGDKNLPNEARTALEEDSMRLGRIMTDVIEFEDELFRWINAPHRPKLVRIK